jgi:hypothetical protein
VYVPLLTRYRSIVAFLLLTVFTVTAVCIHVKMGGESLRPYLKMQNLFVRDINKAVSPAVVRATL